MTRNCHFFVGTISSFSLLECRLNHSAMVQCTGVFIVALLVIGKDWKLAHLQSNVLIVMCHTVENSRENEQATAACKNMHDLTKLILCEGSQPQKSTYYIIPLI